MNQQAFNLFVKRSMLAFSLALLALLPFPHQGRSQPAKPNFVVILADDLGYGDLGVYGAEQIQTPNLDAMADEGLRFTNFYANSTICTPTRAALQTGRYAIRVGLDFVIPLDGPGSQKGMPSGEITLAEALKGAGYATAIIGKWHLGHQDQFNPTLHGYDTWFGVPYSNDYNNGNIPLYRDTQIIENPVDQDTLTQRYTQEALNFIEENAGTPFFLYMPHTAPHVPLHVSPAFKGQSPAGLYGDVVQEMDWSVGQVLAKLKELGLDQNTLVVFTSDNGPWIYQGADGGSPGPFYCGKGSFYEGGVRVPFIARWPGMVQPGGVVDDLAVLFDLYPTLIRLAGAAVPADRVIDAQDISGLLFGNGVRNDDEVIFSLNDNLRAIRAEDWKLLLAYSGGQAWMDECGAAPYPLTLFNLREDPGETTNLAAQYPQVVAYLQGELAAFQASLSQPGNQPPLAQFTIYPTGENALEMRFEAQASSDPDGQLVSYQWEFGDGSSASGEQVTYRYVTTGEYIVTLNVEDNAGLEDGSIRTLQLEPRFLPIILR